MSNPFLDQLNIPNQQPEQDIEDNSNLEDFSDSADQSDVGLRMPPLDEHQNNPIDQLDKMLDAAKGLSKRVGPLVQELAVLTSSISQIAILASTLARSGQVAIDELSKAAQSEKSVNPIRNPKPNPVTNRIPTLPPDTPTEVIEELKEKVMKRGVRPEDEIAESLSKQFAQEDAFNYGASDSPFRTNKPALRTERKELEISPIEYQRRFVSVLKDFFSPDVVKDGRGRIEPRNDCPHVLTFIMTENILTQLDNLQEFINKKIKVEYPDQKYGIIFIKNPNYTFYTIVIWGKEYLTIIPDGSHNPSVHEIVDSNNNRVRAYNNKTILTLRSCLEDLSNLF